MLTTKVRPFQALPIPPKAKRPSAEYILTALEVSMAANADELHRTAEKLKDDRGDKRELLAKIVRNLEELQTLADEELAFLDQIAI